MISGECIDGVGISTMHLTAKRGMGVGMRLYGYTRDGAEDLDLLPDKEHTTMFSLYKPFDNRMREGEEVVNLNGEGYSAFHLHNFLDSIALLRHKYKT